MTSRQQTQKKQNPEDLGDRAGDQPASTNPDHLAEMAKFRELAHEAGVTLDHANGAGTAEPDETVVAADAVPGAGANGAAPDGAPTAATGTDAKPTPAGEPAPAPNMFASAVWLMMASPRHRHLFLGDLQWRLIPPLMLRQFRLFQKDGKPVALATWAMVSDEVATRLEGDGDGDGGARRSDVRLKPAEWRSGERVVLVDVVAPFGSAEAVGKYLRETVLGVHKFRADTNGTVGTANADKWISTSERM